jgi:hypothetical protein
MTRNKSCSAAKETLVATRSVGVGPAVKMDSHSFSEKDAILDWIVVVCCSSVVASGFVSG